MWRRRSRDYSILHLPLPIGAPLEPSLYLQPFLAHSKNELIQWWGVRRLSVRPSVNFCANRFSHANGRIATKLAHDALQVSVHPGCAQGQGQRSCDTRTFLDSWNELLRHWRSGWDTRLQHMLTDEHTLMNERTHNVNKEQIAKPPSGVKILTVTLLHYYCFMWKCIVVQLCSIAMALMCTDLEPPWHLVPVCCSDERRQWPRLGRCKTRRRERRRL